MARKPGVLALLSAALLTVQACGQWQRVGSERPPAPDAVVPGLFEPSGAYRQMGFLAQGPPVAFVGAVRFLAGPVPDSTLVLFSLSLANGTLSFHRAGTLFEAAYRVEATFRAGSHLRLLSSGQTVRVPSYHETQRVDESVIFQQLLYLPPGDLTVELLVRDQGSNGFSRDQGSFKVPRFAAAAGLSSIVPLYRGSPRTDRASMPDLLINPRATVPYGADTLLLYLEAYGGETEVALRAVDERSNEVWRTVVPLAGGSELRSALVRVEPGALPIGRLRLLAAAPGAADTVRAALLVAFSDQWAVANFDEVLNLLRYFGHEDAIRAMRAAPDSARPALWRAFWRETDPNPMTPENEALQQYFARLQAANSRFREGSDPGWLTDRGEVFINLGEPDEIYDQSSDLQGQRRVIRWTYTNDRLVLDFVDDSGFGRFRLTPSSRAEYQRVVNRVRRAG